MARWVYGWLTALVASLPLWLGYAIADALTGLHFRLFPSRRHAALANLAVVMPRATRRERERTARSMMRSYQRMMFEFFRLPHLERREFLESVEFVGREHLEAAAARGRGVVICCTHLGNWELAAVVLAHLGYTLHAVAGVQLNRWFTGAVRESKIEQAIHTVSPEDGFRKLLRALHHGDMIALMVDGDIFSHGAKVEVFGRETRWPAGPGALAQRTGAPIVVGYCERVRPGRFRIVTESPLEPADYPSAEALNAAVVAHAERHIRDHVDQWCIFRPMWEGATTTETASVADAHRLEA